MYPTVLIVEGQAQSGKSTLVANWIASGQKLEVVAPVAPSQLFNFQPDWAEIDGLVIDDVSTWDAESLAEALDTLQQDAEHHDKALMLLIESEADLLQLAAYGREPLLRSEPAQLFLDGTFFRPVYFYYDRVRFLTPADRKPVGTSPSAEKGEFTPM